MVKAKGKVTGISINGKFIPVVDGGEITITAEDLQTPEYTPKIGDSVDFWAGDTMWTGGKVTDIIDGIPYVNGVKLSKDTYIKLT